MTICFNKITNEWRDVPDTGSLSSDWVIDPQFDDKPRAMTLGPKYWRYPGGNSVHVLTDIEIETDPILLADAKAVAKTNVKAYRDSWQFDRFAYDAKSWDCDPQSRMNIMGVLIISLLNGGNLPPGQLFRDHNNNDWPITGAYMAGLGVALLAFVNACYVNSWTHKAQVDNLTTVSAIKAYDYTTGWPSKE